MGSACNICSDVARSDVDHNYFVQYVPTVGNCVCCDITVDWYCCVLMGSSCSSCLGVARFDVENYYFVLYVPNVGNCVCCDISVDWWSYVWMGSACSRFSVLALSDVDNQYFILYLPTAGNCVLRYIGRLLKILFGRAAQVALVLLSRVLMWTTSTLFYRCLLLVTVCPAIYRKIHTVVIGWPVHEAIALCRPVWRGQPVLWSVCTYCR